LRRDVARLHQQGPNVLLEFLSELARERLLRTDIEERLSRYVALSPAGRPH
jgi:hypothetical protein